MATRLHTGTVPVGVIIRVLSPTRKSITPRCHSQNRTETEIYAHMQSHVISKSLQREAHCYGKGNKITKFLNFKSLSPLQLLIALKFKKRFEVATFRLKSTSNHCGDEFVFLIFRTYPNSFSAEQTLGGIIGCKHKWVCVQSRV